MDSLKRRRENLKRWLRNRHSQEELMESSIKEEHGKNPVGSIEKRLSGARRERLTDKTKRTNY
ncbi:MAG TPA: hypothetical protein VE870_01230 [Bacteroidales bacterium]|nr:hypothetical protein [Bacteroidales bacterium]